MPNHSPQLSTPSTQSNPTLFALNDRKSDLPFLTRTRLLQRMKRALPKGIVFVAAPAGYGKSSLLRSLIAQQPDSAYVALSPADTDLNVLRTRLLPLLSQATVLVLDDIHHLVDATETLTWLVECLQSTNLRWVIGGRLIPALLLDSNEAGMAKLRLGAADLAFGANESKVILRGYDESLVAEWRERTQGWPLALALLARQRPGTIALTASTNTREDLFTYLAESIFARLTPALTEFVTISAIPIRFSDDLLAAIMQRSLAEIATLRNEIQRRNLFLEATDELGWFKYHDFVRQYLCGQVDPSLRTEVAERLVSWFETVGNLRLTVEQAIDGQLYERAAQLMKTHGNTLLFDLGWHQSYKRWLFAMPESIQAKFPNVLARLGFALIYLRQFVDEGLSYVNKAQSLSDTTDVRMAGEVSVHAAGAYTVLGEPEKALFLIATAQTHPDLPLRSQILLWLYQASNYAHLYRLRDVKHAYRMATALVEQLAQSDEQDSLRALIRHNRGTQIETIRGDFVRFEQSLYLNKAFDSGKSAALEATYAGFCVLHENLGEWDALAEDLGEIRAARLQQRSEIGNEQTDYQMTAKWEMFYWAAVYIGKGDFSTAQALITNFVANVSDPEAIACGQWLQAWSFRCQQHYGDCITFADAIVPDPSESAQFYRSALAFERATAAFFAGRDDWRTGIEPSLRFQLRLGSKHHLLRWRILFALASYRNASQTNTDKDRFKPNWHKHVTFALCALKRYGYDRLLNQREPELAAHFRTLCLAENIHPEQTMSALKEIGRVEPIANLLISQSRQQGDRETGRQGEGEIRLIQALAAIGREEAIPLLEGLLRDEKKKPVMASIKSALTQLEALPPPKLEVTLLGHFVLKRGGVLIKEDAWQRPGVRQLFHYFCLQHGRRLTRSQIVQDLWPDSDPQSALTAFRLNFSRLRSVLEPNLRSHTPMRYVTVEDETYTFDPQRTLAEIDSERFVRTLEIMLKQKNTLGEDQLAELLQTLESWNPPLAELRYTSWAIHAIEHLNDRYADGCLLAAQQLLTLDRVAEANTWAEQATTVAPWNELGWQTLMRCTAQQGQRSLALKVYERAVTALERELGVPPSEETVRLAQRLRRSEMI